MHETSFNNIFFERGQIIHASLFTGIGGFDLAAEWRGWINAFHCEIDDWCRSKLSKLFPNSEQYANIKEQDFSKWQNKITVLSGGFPCQPVSIAGQRKGDEDERFLWGEMYRAIRQIKPPFIVAENVPGLLTAKHGLLFEQVCLDLENEGYEVQAFVIPACAVNATHRRDRVWIIAYSDSFRQQNEQEKSGQTLCNGKRNGATSQQGGKQQQRRAGKSNSLSTDLQSSEQEQPRNTRTRRDGFANDNTPDWTREWFEVAAELCRVDDGISEGLDRRKRLEAIGNAVVPQVAFEVFGIVDYLIAGYGKRGEKKNIIETALTDKLSYETQM